MLVYSLAFVWLGACGVGPELAPEADASVERMSPAQMEAALMQARQRIEALEAADRVIRQRIVALELAQEQDRGRIGGVESSTSALQAAFRDLTTDTQEVARRVGGVETQLAAVSGHVGFPIGAVDDVDLSLVERVAQAETRAGRLERAVGTPFGTTALDDYDGATIFEMIGPATTDDFDFAGQSLYAVAAAVYDDVDMLSSSFTTLYDDVDMLSASVGFLYDDVDMLSASVERLHGDVGTLSTSLTGFYDDVDMLSASVASIHDDVDEVSRLVGTPQVYDDIDLDGHTLFEIAGKLNDDVDYLTASDAVTRRHTGWLASAVYGLWDAVFDGDVPTCTPPDDPERGGWECQDPCTARPDGSYVCGTTSHF